MKEWTFEELHRTYEPADSAELEKNSEKLKNSPWRCDYHIQTLTGLMNDPNGFARYNGRWHLFYQWFPFGGIHGMKHWYHVSSPDLLHWKNEGLAMKPDVLYDNYGCYSGSAFVKDGQYYLAYTGNNRDYSLQRHQYQLLAKMNEDGTVEKLPGALISPQEGYTEHQRDPKLFEHNGKYYILIGAQNENKKGKILVFASDEIESGWTRLGELKIPGYDSFGEMVECPDIEQIGDRWVLLFSIQGLEKEPGTFPNLNNSVYFTGQMNFDELEFVPDGPYRELDLGFDFYAPQCSFGGDETVMFGWSGCPGCTYPPVDEEGWEGLQTLPRILKVENGKLMQKLPEALNELRGEVLFNAENGSIVSDSMHGLMPKTAVIRLDDPDGESVELNLFTRPRKKGFEISYDKNRKKLTIDRTDMINQFNEEYGTVRTLKLEDGLKSLEIYIDRSIVEVFVNDGEYVFTSRIFPEAQENLIRMGGRNIDLKIWKPMKTNDETFII